MIRFTYTCNNANRKSACLLNIDRINYSASLIALAILAVSRNLRSSSRIDEKMKQRAFLVRVSKNVCKNTTRTFVERSRESLRSGTSKMPPRRTAHAHAQHLPRTRISTKNRTQKWEGAFVVFLIALARIISHHWSTLSSIRSSTCQPRDG